MRYLLNVLYLLLVAALSPLLVYRAVRTGKYRAGLAEKWLGRVPRREGQRKCAWLHAVSVGEVNLLAPLLSALEAKYPDWEFVISTTSATGYALAQKKYAPRTVFYAPLDFSWAVENALARVRPEVLILAELELWPNLISAARRRGVAVAIVNGRLSEKSFRGYRWMALFLRRVLAQVDVVLAQNEAYAERFRALGARRVEVTGSIKFDGAQTRRDNPRTSALAKLAGIDAGDVVFLAGSTQAPEEELVLAAYRQLRDEYPQLRLLIVPRHPERFEEVAEVLKKSGERFVRRSELSEGVECKKKNEGSTGKMPVPPRVLLVDTVGELGAWWGAAQIGFVGGSLLNSRGGQSMIEPAAYGVATCFGPSTRNFRDAVKLLLEGDAATVVHSGEEMTQFVGRCLADLDFARRLGENARRLVQEQLGATERTVKLLEPLLEREANGEGMTPGRARAALCQQASRPSPRPSPGGRGGSAPSPRPSPTERGGKI